MLDYLAILEFGGINNKLWLLHIASPELSLKAMAQCHLHSLSQCLRWKHVESWCSLASRPGLRDKYQASDWPCLTRRWYEEWHRLSSDLHLPTCHLPHLQHTGYHKVQAFQIVRWTSRLPSGSFSLFHKEEALILFCLFVLGKCYFYDNYFDLPGALLCARVVDSLTKVWLHLVISKRH